MEPASTSNSTGNNASNGTTSTEELLATAVSGFGGADRPGQRRMANAVESALGSGRHLAVQAGTGTGKSLAYLVPAFRHAQETDTCVIVSTATLALQRQLIERDLPRLADALEPVMERRPTFAIMKGRSNYLCMNKIAQAQLEPELEAAAEDAAAAATDAAAATGHTAEEAASETPARSGNPQPITWLGKQIATLHNWAQETETGDRDDLDTSVSDAAWRHVSVSSQECLGASRCPHGVECFAELARQEAREVDVVVTNHAMLAIDAISEIDTLPEHECVIIDEAHELDARITSATTAELSPRSLTLAANRAGPLGAEGKDSRLKDLAEQWRITTEDLPDGRWTELDQAADSELSAIAELLSSLRATLKDAPEGEATNEPETAAERNNLRNHLATLEETVHRIQEVFDTDDPAAQDDVVWLDRNERYGDTLQVAPLSVADLLRDRLFGENTVVLTSATLTLGGRFDAMGAQWGLPKGKWDSLDAGTPFNPAKSGILYAPKHLPQPGRDGLAPETLEEMRELIMAAGGRTLGLFSSKRAAVQAADELRPKLPFPVYVQGEDSIGALVEKFAAKEHSVLFGTLTLWQGVDVPGKACSLVLMDRIPFPRPDNPLLQARSEAAQAAGRNGFMEVSATHAALLMAQGAGRLLRSVTDRGVVAVLDNRVVTKRYGQFLLSSLPPFWRTQDKNTVLGALKRLVQS
ncbi:ATP-dependent DNA helicase [Corynebacterium propinquum]|uniref:ATP-dependent helicase DinG n=1 Tax=Corynebacterium propinquum TaxID=43769 RepID=A0AAP4FA23_9CORY|nr:ATP-dependent DNA helicase [Corynebacterium propinquum]MDK4257523.1 ATP-dependent DNA helicase [Corynebacterium propinquum]MDK4282056.1 ATP-dependent DNA helicase [Corynebacterium propinquum]MDK4297912.1 ATP-dependent DNA helicase [Corynebacterium propinquum]MDK4319816.1 ATP-dependent DNA helicase [Corynebacterium propinquum]MDK4326078.1 ATP-dependent DNA helicase [Corynebacterium propinquum]